MEPWKGNVMLFLVYCYVAATLAYPGYFRQQCTTNRECVRKLGFGYCMGGYCERNLRMFSRTCSTRSEEKCPQGFECINYYCRELGGGIKMFTSGFHFRL